MLETTSAILTGLTGTYTLYTSTLWIPSMCKQDSKEVGPLMLTSFWHLLSISDSWPTSWLFSIGSLWRDETETFWRMESGFDMGCLWAKYLSLYSFLFITSYVNIRMSVPPLLQKSVPCGMGKLACILRDLETASSIFLYRKSLTEWDKERQFRRARFKLRYAISLSQVPFYYTLFSSLRSTSASVYLYAICLSVWLSVCRIVTLIGRLAASLDSCHSRSCILSGWFAFWPFDTARLVHKSNIWLPALKFGDHRFRNISHTACEYEMIW